MSYESVIANLKRLNKHQLVKLDPEAHVSHMLAESDRSVIILLASNVEATLLGMLEDAMPSLNGEERDRIFNFEGPCGSFSNRIRLAQGLGIINRETRKQVEILKEMRNAAAHSFLPVNYETPAIKTRLLRYSRLTPAQMLLRGTRCDCEQRSPPSAQP